MIQKDHKYSKDKAIIKGLFVTTDKIGEKKLSERVELMDSDNLKSRSEKVGMDYKSFEKLIKKGRFSLDVVHKSRLYLNQ